VQPKLRSLIFFPLDVPLLEPFGIATGAHLRLENVLVRLELEDGTVGLGEAAPVPHISGETPAQVLAAEDLARRVLAEAPNLGAYRKVSAGLAEALAPVPSALAGVEMALLDALCRRAGQSLLDWFGGREASLVTDITVTTGTLEHARRSAAKAERLGFRSLKVKIGGANLADDVERLLAIAEVAPNADLLLDGNTAFSPVEALHLLRELGTIKSRVKLFEQPVPREDWSGLAEVEAKSGIPVAADESLRSRDDLTRILRTGGISVVNVKTAKLGLIAAYDVTVTALCAGLQVMVGGMVETELSMTASACLAAGVGGVRFIDLDTPLFLGPRPLSGGFLQTGPALDLGGISAGHGVSYHGPLPAAVAR
jgi:L-alanine-DL-glutamate epimerase-like enolase superfamily enzyme